MAKAERGLRGTHEPFLVSGWPSEAEESGGGGAEMPPCLFPEPSSHGHLSSQHPFTL